MDRERLKSNFRRRGSLKRPRRPIKRRNWILLRPFWSVSLDARVVTAPPVAATAVERLAPQPIAIIGVSIVVVSDDDNALVMPGVFVSEEMGQRNKRRNVDSFSCAEE